MLKHPKLKSSFHAEFLDDDNILLISEKDNAMLSGRLYRLVLSGISENSVSTDELVRNLEGKASIFEIYYALDVLERKGYVTESTPSLPREMCAFWNSLGMDVKTLLDVLREKPVTLETVGSVTPDVFTAAFAAHGIRITDGDSAIRVVVTDDYEQEAFRAINQKAFESGLPWMAVKPTGTEFWIGPVFLPGKTGCWACLKQRLEINRPLYTLYKTRNATDENPPVPLAFLPSSLQTAANMTALEIVKWLYFGENKRLESRIVTFDAMTLESGSHVLVKRPQCRVCGTPQEQSRAPEPVVLKPTAFCDTACTGYREKPPEDTIEKYSHHVSPVTGVAQKLTPYFSISGAPVYNYSAGNNIAFRSRTLFWLNNHIRSASGGKGKNWSQAKAGALCEAIERYSIVWHGDAPRIAASLAELGDDGIHPNVCMNYSVRQYQNREATNRECAKFYFMTPVPFDKSLAMDWSPVYSLTERKFRYLPSCFCYAQYPAEDDYNLFAYPDSNGCAAGNSMEEAVLQGFLELAERDSTAVWWYNRIRRPAVDLSSFDDPYFGRVADFYRSINRSVYVLDLTTDLQIPSFAAVSHRLEGEKQEIVFGFGAHVDAKIGVERSLIELNQILPIVDVSESDRREGKYRTPDKHFLDWLNTATLDSQPYLRPLEDAPEKKAADYPRLCAPDIYESVMFCIKQAADSGLETLVLDMTQPDVGLPVAKVIVPGMRHFWKRLGPGRLYDVPVKMGWAETPLKEEDMNPVGLFV